MHAESHRRIDLYQQHVARTLDALHPVSQDPQLWRDAHKHFAEITRERIDCEVAETFFNAITRKVFQTVGVNKRDRVPGKPLSTKWFRRCQAAVPTGFEHTDDLEALFERHASTCPEPSLRVCRPGG